MAKVAWSRETMAGLAGAIGSVPDGMATAVLAGAQPDGRAVRVVRRTRRRGLLQSTTVM